MIALHHQYLSANRSSIFEQQLINSRLLIVYTKTLKLLVSPLSSCALFSVPPYLRGESKPLPAGPGRLFRREQAAQRATGRTSFSFPSLAAVCLLRRR